MKRYNDTEWEHDVIMVNMPIGIPVEIKYCITDEGQYGIYYVGKAVDYRGVIAQARTLDELKEHLTRIYEFFKEKNLNPNDNVYV